MALVDDFPNWIPKKEWNAWLKLRKAKRVPLIAESFPYHWSKLLRLKDQGYEPGLVLQQSVDLGWTGLFELKESWLEDKGLKARGIPNGNHQSTAGKSRGERHTEAHRAYVEACEREAEAEAGGHVADIAQPSTRH